MLSVYSSQTISLTQRAVVVHSSCVLASANRRLLSQCASDRSSAQQQCVDSN
jgi:hypothetical protein